MKQKKTNILHCWSPLLSIEPPNQSWHVDLFVLFVRYVVATTSAWRIRQELEGEKKPRDGP